MTNINFDKFFIPCCLVLALVVFPARAETNAGDSTEVTEIILDEPVEGVDDSSSVTELPAASDLGDDSPGQQPAARHPADEPHPCNIDPSYRSWYDKTHQFLSKRACEPSLWFDNFFGDQGERSSKRGTTVRLIGSVSYDEHSFDNSALRYKVRAHLPNLSRKLHLVINDETDESDDSFSLEAQRPDVAAANDQEDEADQFRAALRWALRESRRIDLDTDLGITSSYKAFLKTRYRYRYTLSDISNWRFKQQVNWEDTDGWEEKSLFEYNRVLNEKTLFRWSNRYEFSEATKEDKVGGVWRTSFAWSYQIDVKKAVTYVIGARGISREKEPIKWEGYASYAVINTGVQTYVLEDKLGAEGYKWEGYPTAATVVRGSYTYVPRELPARTSLINGYFTSIRYRQNIFRPWLFFEIEPFVDWAIEHGYSTNTGIALRLENWIGS